MQPSRLIHLTTYLSRSSAARSDAATAAPDLMTLATRDLCLEKTKVMKSCFGVFFSQILNLVEIFLRLICQDLVNNLKLVFTLIFTLFMSLMCVDKPQLLLEIGHYKHFKNAVQLNHHYYFLLDYHSYLFYSLQNYVTLPQHFYCCGMKHSEKHTD